ncbi:unnamed protein product, partial [Brassica oleracea]
MLAPVIVPVRSSRLLRFWENRGGGGGGGRITDGIGHAPFLFKRIHVLLFVLLNSY